MQDSTDNTVDPASAPPTNATSSSDSPAYPREMYAWYVVLILMIVYVFSFMDRQILSLLVDPIKADLNITDTQVSCKWCYPRAT